MNDDVEVVEQTTGYRGYFRVDRYRLKHRRFDGGWTPVVTREVLERGHAAAVLLFDPRRDEVALVEQFRIGALAAGRDPWMIEVVAGLLEPGEAPEAVARREATEEAGATVLDLVPIATYLTTPGASTETIALYCGRVSTEGMGGVFGLEAEDEDIRVLVMPTAEALAMTDHPRVANAMTIVALQWLRLHHLHLRRQWLGEET